MSKTAHALAFAPVGIVCERASSLAIEAACLAAEEALARSGVTPFQGRYAEFTFAALAEDGLLIHQDVDRNAVEVDLDTLCRTHRVNEGHLKAWFEAKGSAAASLLRAGCNEPFEMELDVDHQRPAAWASRAR